MTGSRSRDGLLVGRGRGRSFRAWWSLGMEVQGSRLIDGDGSFKGERGWKKEFFLLCTQYQPILIARVIKHSRVYLSFCPPADSRAIANNNR